MAQTNDLTTDIDRYLRSERERIDRQRREQLASKMWKAFAYQWKCIAFGTTVERAWKFNPHPLMSLRRPRAWRNYVRHWTRRSQHGVMPGSTSRARLCRHYGPFTLVIKPRYWSDCAGDEPAMFHEDKEWSVDRWLEHRRLTMSDWTEEDDQEARAWFASRYGGRQ